MPIPVFGSQLFINRQDHPEFLRAQVRLMHAHGLRLIRLFSFWDQVEPWPGVWIWEVTDAIFAEAAALGMGVVPTLCAQTPPGWWWTSRVGSCQDVADLTDPGIRAAGLAYIRAYVGRYARHPGLHSWIVWNEASMTVPVTSATVHAYRLYLAETYTDIASYNAMHYRQYQYFSEIVLESNGDGPIIQTSVDRLDWMRFSVNFLMHIVADFTHEIRAHDGQHPVHVNPHLVGSCMFRYSQSLWQIAEQMDFMGTSAHPVHHSTRFPLNRVVQSLGLFCSLTRSATRDPNGRFWVSELQGGPSIFGAARFGSVSPGELRTWLWECIGQGSEAIVYWTFTGRNSDGESGEWMLLDQRGQPSRRLRESAQCVAMIDQHADLFDRLGTPRPQVMVLDSEATSMLGYVCGQGESVSEPRCRERGTDAIAGAYSLLDDLGLDVAFTSEPRLAEPATLAGIDVLILPDSQALEPATAALVAAFVARGGWVIADGLVGWKTPSNRLDPLTGAALGVLFGAELEDLDPTPGPITLETEAGPVPGWLAELSLATISPETEVLARWDDERIAATAKFYASGGRAVRLGSFFFQRYAAHHEPAIRDFIAGLLPPQLSLRVQEDGVRLRFRPLPDGGGLYFAINTNGHPARALLPPGDYRELASTLAELTALPAAIAAIELQPQQVRILRG